MAFRKAPWRKLRPSEVLPVWKQSHTDTVTIALRDLFYRMGVTDVPSYLKKLSIPIAICVVVCAIAGGVRWGITGFLLGGLSGVLAPAALLWLGVILLCIAIYLGIYIAAWAVIWAIAKWCLSEFFRF